MMQKFEVKNLSPLNTTSYLLTLKNISKNDFYWSAGQYMAVYFDRRGRKTPVRCFSIVGDPTDNQTISVAIKKTGKFTRALNEIEQGQTVYVQGPFGDFLLPDRADIPLVFFAGGIGITPFISMLLDLASMQNPNPVHLYYACRTQDDLTFVDTLQKLVSNNPNLRVGVILKDGIIPKGDKLSYSSGQIDSNFVTSVVKNAAKNSMYYLCGPDGFMNGIASALVKQDVTEDNIVIEAFGQRNLVSAQERFTASKKIYMASALGLLLGFGILSSSSVTKALKAEFKEHEAAETQPSPDSSSSTQTSQPTGTDTSASGSSATTSTYTDSSSSSTSSSGASQQQTYTMPMSGVS